jgi:hypothetical protein
MKRRTHLPVASYPRDTVLLIGEVADALRVSERTVMRARLPVAYLTDQTPRYIWGQVIDELVKRAAEDAVDGY